MPNVGQRDSVGHRDFRGWLCCVGDGLAVLYALLWFAVPSQQLRSQCQNESLSVGSKRTISSFTPFMRLKFVRYSSSSARKFFSLSCAFSALVCTGSCFASLP